MSENTDSISEDELAEAIAGMHKQFSSWQECVTEEHLSVLIDRARAEIAAGEVYPLEGLL